VSALDDILALDAQIGFASADMAFEVESIVYIRHAGTNRTFNAQVFREPMMNIEGVTVPSLRVFIPRSATVTVGINYTPNRTIDKVRVAIDRGGSTSDLPVAEIESEDAGGYMLKLL
jgi:hypothetical protein